MQDSERNKGLNLENRNTLPAACNTQLSIPVSDQELVYCEKELQDDATVQSVSFASLQIASTGISNDDMIQVQSKSESTRLSQI